MAREGGAAFHNAADAADRNVSVGDGVFGWFLDAASALDDWRNGAVHGGTGSGLPDGGPGPGQDLQCVGTGRLNSHWRDCSNGCDLLGSFSLAWLAEVFASGVEGWFLWRRGADPRATVAIG